MDSFWMQANYRAIFSEMLLAHSAAMGAFADVAARCALRASQGYQQALVALAGEIPPEGAAAEPPHPGGGPEIAGASAPRAADLAREFTGMPRISTMVFLSQYDKLRGRRSVVRD
jgi:hypothetical protein